MSTESSYVLLDRDGVINRDVPTSVCSVDVFEMLPDSARAIAMLCEHGYRIVVLTNQACVGRGELLVDELSMIHDRLRSAIAAAGGEITDILVCPHTDIDNCKCRKPRPGLILDAAERYGIDLPNTWFVGDSMCDVQAALVAGCRPALVRTGKPLNDRQSDNIPIFNSLLEFALLLHRADKY
jgi:D-glycero-D-manno-heptose 1,7-bisphosphate phosphatase